MPSYGISCDRTHRRLAMASLDPLIDKDGVQLTVDDAIATVTLANPAKRNAQSPALWRALTQAGRSLPGSVRVVVLRAEGKSFSAGLDRQAFTPEGFDGEPSFIDLARGSDTELDATIAEYQEAFTWWRRSDIVSIAAVQGHAIGAGFQLALACDLRVVADDVQFAMRETSLGLVPDLTGTHPLVNLVGYARALEICATGRFVTAEEAERTGLANLAVPADQLDDTVRDLAGALLSAPRDAVIETKALLRGAQDRSYEEQRTAERAAQARRLRDLAGVGE
jgi:enoyl-CoA hydratase/carnithine racemase